MRTAFITTLTELARQDPRIMLLTGDLGYTVFEAFAAERPRQYLNCGVAEANMIGTAAGLAKAGYRPWVYSIVPFATLRCLEQIRNDLCYHRLPVTVVGIGAGYSYGDLGATHHAIEDLAVTRALPNMTVVAPGDPVEVDAAVRALAHQAGPAYLRLGKRGEPKIHQRPLDFQLGVGIRVRRGPDLALIAISTMLETAVRTADELARQPDRQATVVSMPTLKPLDAELVTELAYSFPCIFTLEEHSILGGLGGAVAEVMAQIPAPKARLIRLGVPDCFQHVAGSPQYLRSLVGLTPSAISARIIREMTQVWPTVPRTSSSP